MNQRKANVRRRPVARHVDVLSVLRSLAWLVILFMFMAVTRGASAPPAHPGASKPDVQKPVRADAPPAFARLCSGKCHSADRITDGRRSRAQWDEVIEKMVGEGAEGSDEDFAAVTKYLVSEFGRVNINADPATDLATVLHLNAKDADAIVAYRKEHGKFEDFAALSAVPGIAVEALQARRDAIVF